ncbi:uncharacterized protein L201_002940 [Kwoniella dendrophila CBS 6074]|uniref:Uncharacterized protein n=1 Tax=Kwoniella dendrophila CBS 6074 TaxID=1295534 RepID=A0AAX4JRK4_9TREE
MSPKKPVPPEISLPSTTPPPIYTELSEGSADEPTTPLDIGSTERLGNLNTALPDCQAINSQSKNIADIPYKTIKEEPRKANSQQPPSHHPPPPPPPRVFDWDQLSQSPSSSSPSELNRPYKPSTFTPTNKLKKVKPPTKLPIRVVFNSTPPTPIPKEKEPPGHPSNQEPPQFYPTGNHTPWYSLRSKMSAPPRMLILSGGGYEAFVAMPPTYEKAVALATEKFNIPSTHVIRLSCKAADMQWIAGYAGAEDIFVADNDSFHYACAGKHVARLGVHVYDKNAKPGVAPSAPAGGGDKSGGAKAGEGGKKEEKKEAKAPPPPPTADQSLTCQTTAGKSTTLNAKVTGEFGKGIPAGNYLGTLAIEDKTWKQSFIGNQLGPNEVMTKYIVHDKNTARLLFRPRSVRPSVEFLHPEEKSLEVSLSVADWTVTSAYPMTSLLPDGARQKLRWFLKVHPKGVVEDMLTGTQTSGLFMEMIPSPKAKPDKAPEPDAPLIPAWPDIRPSNAWCLPQTIFIPHIDRILSSLGLPVESRTAMITSWLPGLTRHKNIAYRILNRSQLDPSSSLTIIPPPSVMLRIFVIFKGIPDSDLKDWENAGVLHAEMGLDWRDSVGWTPDLQNESLFRVIEYGAM